ncbi:MAG TPA: hypothetical protein VFO40_22900 [Chthoniobacterales bacterium]|nr:hypothetical protein [Chthoniobacterales bacterium]
MQPIQESPTVPKPKTPPDPAAVIQFITPDYYELSGDNISVSYYPTAAGGQPWLIYHDPQLTRGFRGNEIRNVDVPDLGTIVSVTLHPTVDFGSTTFSLLVPQVNLVDRLGASAPIRTIGITTVHRGGILPPRYGQRELYTETALSGTAWNKIIPL